MYKRITALLLAMALFITCASCSKPVDENAPSAVAAAATTAPLADSELESYAQQINAFGGRAVTPQFLKTVSPDVLAPIMEAVSAGTYTAALWHSVAGFSLHVLLDRFEGKQDSIDKGYNGKGGFTLSFVGDINFNEGSYVMPHCHAMPNGILDCISADLVAEMRAADIMLANNEFTYSDRGSPLPGKTYTFRAKPESVSMLDTIGVDIVSLANNHVYDYGEVALLDTIDTLAGANMPYVGAGKNINEASAAVSFIINGYKVSYVAASRAEKEYFTKEATEAAPGILGTYDSAAYCEAIKKAKSESDIVIAYVHWGTEATDVLEQEQLTMAREYIDAGASAVIGAHPHRVQGMDFYNGVPIAYSLGNFWFNTKTLKSCLVTLTVTNEGEIGMKYLPCMTKDSETRLVTDASERRAFFDYVESIQPNNITIDNEGNVLPK